MDYFPVCLDLREQPCLVIGKGRLAEEKARLLAAVGAKVRMSQEFLESEAAGSFLVIAITHDHSLGERISQFARQHKILVNVLDQTENCNFIFPAVMRQGSLSIAVSTDGKSPMLAVSIRDELKKQYGPEYGSLLHILGELRVIVKKALPEYEDRRDYYAALINANLLPTLNLEGSGAVRRKAFQILRACRLQKLHEKDLSR